MLKVLLAILICSIFITSRGYTQITAEVYIENTQVVGSTFSWEIHFRPISGWTGGQFGANAYLKNASWYFYFNHNALTAPVITYMNPLVDGHYNNYCGITGITKVYGSTVDIGDSQPVVEDTKYHIYTISMTITDPEVSSNLIWNQHDTGIENYSGDIADIDDLTFTGSGDISLPVELSGFTAISEKGAVILKWTTESEIENLGFNIYRSTKDNDQFSIINDQLIPGAGSSSQKHDYEYIDKDVINSVTYWYKLEDVDYSGHTELHGPVSATPIAKATPSEFRLYPNYPNPFNPVTTISYDLPEDGYIELSIYNMRGENVTTLLKSNQEAGSYKMNWDGTNQNGEIVSSGIYFLRIASGSYCRTSKMVFIR